ncbi:MAG TPA: phosphoesterase, partial [Actinomycetota bacterium]|nr:phosphoesterase [Actinomycetota bacterium]
MHLLGYFVPQEPNPLSDALAELQDARANRNRRMVERLNDLGIPLTFEEVEMEAVGPGAQIGRPHFAAVLVRHGAVPDYQSAFDKYLAKGAPGYMSRKLYKPEDAIELMTLAGVVPVLAHPFTLHLDDVDLAGFVSDLAAAGLAGIEGWHGDRPAEDQRRYRDLAEKLSLIVTGGSDYHGHMRPDRPLRGGKHGVTVPPECLDDLRAAARSMSRAR